ncbi:hypothetical protein SAMN05421630_112106 [Prauserella marina]|uniref:Uncharacterized protein n=1 Tax=Prauserella marina TaxID=530584 RepID=A0A1G6XK98_9PSEU|nr:hypothetical protein DES30_110132 [Prauserella marina]SDD77785.1 hypothetical protein SAMN05421630_112106 [Prauserella marina]
MPSRAVPVSTLTPAEVSQRRMISAVSAPRRSCCGAGPLQSKVTWIPSLLRETAASQPMKPAPTTIALRARFAAARSSRPLRADRRVRTAGSSTPGTLGGFGSAPVAYRHRP